MELNLHVEERTIFRRIHWNLVIFIMTLNIVGLFNRTRLSFELPKLYSLWNWFE